MMKEKKKEEKKNKKVFKQKVYHQIINNVAILLWK